MTPADERLGAAHASRADVQLRLIVQLELLELERAAQLGFEHEAVVRDAAHLGRVEAVASAGGFLRRAHRDLRAPEQGFERSAIVRKEADADRKSTRLNSSHVKISYAVFCLKK